MPVATPTTAEVTGGDTNKAWLEYTVQLISIRLLYSLTKNEEEQAVIEDGSWSLVLILCCALLVMASNRFQDDPVIH